jgi:hypothetical protein
MNDMNTLVSPIPNSEGREVGGVRIDVVKAGASRVKRMMYPPGFRWSTNMKPIVGTEWCMHAHVGFLAQGQIHVQYPDGCTLEFSAPQVVVIEPGHDGWVVGQKAAVVIEFDFEGETASRLGMPSSHTHAGKDRGA